jgi:multimeric flavodoxin WrbA
MTKIKVLGVSGSPRKGKNTEGLLRAAMNTADPDAAIEVISLSDFRISPCDGCNVCVREKRCPLDAGDDMGKLKEKLTDADAVIFAAPSYFGAVPGVMKNMMDRSRPLKMDDHRLKGMVVSAIVTSGLRDGGAEQVAESIARFGLMHGMIVVGGCGDPLTSGHFGIASLQGDSGWRRADADVIALNNASGVVKRVVDVAKALKGAN